MYESDIFISYSRKDEKFVGELKSRLEAERYVVWMDKEIRYGARWRTEINKRLENTLLVVVITSKPSMKSAYVTYEWCYGCLVHGKEFHWIQIDDCHKQTGMFGLLMDDNNAPLRCYPETMQEANWQEIVKSVGVRLTNISKIRQSAQILNDPDGDSDAQAAAAKYLGHMNNRFHLPFARQQLLNALILHTSGHGPVQRSIVNALQNLADLSAIPYLSEFCKIPHEDDISKSAKRLLKSLISQTNHH